MSFAYITLTINPSSTINDYTRLLRELEESEVVEEIRFEVD